MNKFTKSLNQKVNKKTFPETPENKDTRVHKISKLMMHPVYTKAFSEAYGDDPKLAHVEQYKKENDRTHSYIQEIAAMRAEVIDKTPFDNEEQNLFRSLITQQSHIHVLSKQAIRDLKSLKDNFHVMFEKNGYKYLFGKTEPMYNKALIRLINRDLRSTCNLNGISYNVKSHSFRIHVISSLLKLTSVQHVADIIGHNDIRSTLKYSRYSLSKKEVQGLMDTIANAKPDRPEVE